MATYEYNEWGNVTSITGNQALADANPYRYVGKYGVLYDKDINLYLMGWRDYDPSTGRFIVPDEYEGEEDEPTSLNRYLYADADPVNNKSSLKANNPKNARYGNGQYLSDIAPNISRGRSSASF